MKIDPIAIGSGIVLRSSIRDITVVHANHSLAHLSQAAKTIKYFFKVFVSLSARGRFVVKSVTA